MWSYTSQPVRLFVIDARALLPLGLFLFHVRFWTFYVAIVGVAVFAALSWFGFTVPVAFRTARRFITGPYRPAVPGWRKRRYA